MLNNFSPENRDIYEIIWKNKAERGGPQISIPWVLDT